MIEIQTMIRENDHHPMVPISNPFQPERVVLPFKTSLRNFNFFELVRGMVNSRVTRDRSMAARLFVPKFA